MGIEEEQQEIKNFQDNKKTMEQEDLKQIKDLILELGVDKASKLVNAGQRSMLGHTEPSKKTMEEIRVLENRQTKLETELNSFKESFDKHENEKQTDLSVDVLDLKTSVAKLWETADGHIKYTHFWGIVILLCTIVGGILANMYSQFDELETSEGVFHKDIEKQISQSDVQQAKIETQLAQIQADIIAIKKLVSEIK